HTTMPARTSLAQVVGRHAFTAPTAVCPNVGFGRPRKHGTPVLGRKAMEVKNPKEPKNLKEPTKRMSDAANAGDGNAADSGRGLHFIETIIEDDRQTNKFGGRVHTRF